jgi:ribokinase
MSSAQIVVMGSFVVDLMGRAPHLPVNGETVKGGGFKIGPGGKGSNQGVAASRAGSNVLMITKIGQDQFGEVALNSFRSEGMNTEFIFVEKSYPTGAALILVDENTSENMILVTLGACEHLTTADLDRALARVDGKTVFLTQLETNLDAVQYALDVAHSRGARIILNPAPVQPVPDEIYQKVDILTPNEVEAAILSGVPIEGPGDAERAAAVLLARGVKSVIITLGSKGAMVVHDGQTRMIEPVKVDVVDTTGAGDAFNGALATAIAEGRSIEDAAAFANVAAALSVTKIGTAPSTPYRKDIDAMMKKLEGGKNA